MRFSRCSVFTKFSSKLLSVCLISAIASSVSMSVWAESKLKVLTNFTVLLQSALIALFVVAVIGLKWRDFLLHAFDPIQARVVGLKNDFLYYGLLIMLSLTVVGGLKAVGIILVISLLVAPGAIAFLMTRNFIYMLAIAVTVSIFACFFSVILSFHIDSAPAPTIVVTLSALFLLLLLKEIKGPLKKKVQME